MRCNDINGNLLRQREFAEFFVETEQPQPVEAFILCAAGNPRSIADSTAACTSACLHLTISVVSAFGDVCTADLLAVGTEYAGF